MALKLIIENHKGELSIHQCASSIINVGRSQSNELTLVDRNISRHHFFITHLDNRLIIEDKGSHNGTFVNDKEILSASEIFVGDIITVGDYNIYLEMDSNSSGYVTLKKESAPTTAETTLLLAKSGTIAGKAFQVEGNETIIGSHPAADIYLYSPNIPEVHTKIIFDGNMYLAIKNNAVGDLKLIINDMEVTSIDLRDGDEILIDNYLFEFIEPGTTFDPVPFKEQSEKERKRKLLEDIDNKKIKSIHDSSSSDEDMDNEVTQVGAPLPPQKPGLGGFFKKLFKK